MAGPGASRYGRWPLCGGHPATQRQTSRDVDCSSLHHRLAARVAGGGGSQQLRAGICASPHAGWAPARRCAPPHQVKPDSALLPGASSQLACFAVGLRDCGDGHLVLRTKPQRPLAAPGSSCGTPMDRGPRRAAVGLGPRPAASDGAQHGTGQDEAQHGAWRAWGKLMPPRGAPAPRLSLLARHCGQPAAPTPRSTSPTARPQRPQRHSGPRHPR